jgi:hypothetical protein
MNFENFPQESADQEEPKKKKGGFLKTVAAAVGIAAGGVMAQEKGGDDGIIKGFGFQPTDKNIESVEGGDIDAMFTSEGGSSDLKIKKADLSGSDFIPASSSDLLEEGEAWSAKGKNLNNVEAENAAKAREAQRKINEKKKADGDFTVSMHE